MIGYRTVFCCLPLFLTLATIVSSAPILDVQLISTKLGEAWVNETLSTTTAVTELTTVADDDDSSSSDDDDDTVTTTTMKSLEETTVNGQLPANATDLPLDIDEILKLTERIFSVDDGELPSTPTTENPEDDDE